MSLRRLGTVLVALAGAPVALQAQGANPDPLMGGWAEVSGWILKAVELVPEDKWNYRPVATVRTFGELAGHIADGNDYYCGQLAGKKVDWVEKHGVSKAGRAAVIAELKRSIAACTAAIVPANSARVAQALANIGHANLHYGNMITYLRMMGLTPPSS